MKYYYENDVIEQLKKTSQLIVFGAGNVASLIVECLRDDFYRFPLDYCLVSDTEVNPERVKEVPVINYAEAEGLVRKDAVILIAVAERYLSSAMEGLNSHGYRNLVPLTYESDLWSLLRGNIYRNERLLKNRLYLTVEEELSGCVEKTENTKIISYRTVRIYSVRSHADKPLNEDISRYSWEIPIQAGAALTNRRICEVCDNTGENISDKNKQYCELTALYWIWKNDTSGYVGLGHYRRHFEMDEKQLKLLAGSDIDVVLTIPIMDSPSVEAVYRRDHIGIDWEVMLEAVERLAPKYMDTVKRMQSGRFYYAYNMFIMRREILEDYCEWLFPILFYCEKHCEEYGKDGSRVYTLSNADYQNRYIGFLAEHLMSVYFMYHEEEYKIVHAKNNFIL